MLFHCCTELYPEDRVIGPYERSRFSTLQESRGLGLIESIVEVRKPPEQPFSRENAIYAADSAPNAAIFLNGQLFAQGDQPPVFCYEVEAAMTSKAPMVLFGLIEWVKDDPQKAAEIAAEYWAPKHRWGFTEYFAPSMRILREVEWPSTSKVLCANASYEADRKRAIELFGLEAIEQVREKLIRKRVRGSV